MQEKTIDPDQPLHLYLQKYPDLIALLKEAGIKEAENPFELKLKARNSSLSRLLQRSQTDSEKVLKLLRKNGYTVLQKEADTSTPLLYQNFYAQQEENQVLHKDPSEFEESHPFHTLLAENKEMERRLNHVKDALSFDDETILTTLHELKPLGRLYSFIEEVIMPMLYRYGFDEPTDGIWNEEDDARHTMSRIVNHRMMPGSLVKEETEALITKIETVRNHQEQLLYPLVLDHFTEEQWVEVYVDYKRYGTCFLSRLPVWKTGEDNAYLTRREEGIDTVNKVIRFERGSLTYDQLKSILERLPLDITYIDKNDINRYFQDNERIFLRPTSALDRPMSDCHPPRIKNAVRNLLNDFHSGKRDHLEIWTEHPEPLHVLYLATYDENGKYAGTVEIAQRFEEAISHFIKK
jgi:DUF438 domain-containing protein